MPQDISVMFLGTSSGGGPTSTRNCSSLVMDFLGDGSLWMVDCAEGTSRQFERQPSHGAQWFKPNRLTKIFITHMHADHTMGIIGLLRNVLGIPKPGAKASLKVQLFGPAGLRNFVRTIFAATDTKTLDNYSVHELLGPDEDPSALCTPEAMHPNESEGSDIRCGDDGFWREFVQIGGRFGRKDVFVDAGVILHRVHCIGYIMREAEPNTSREGADEYPIAESLPRKLVVLGDTHSPEAIVPLIESSPGSVSLLIHEATDCHIPHSVDPEGLTGRNRSIETIHKVSLERGHSTPTMAGLFAKRIGAERLFLNHIGGRFPAPPMHPQGRNDKFRLSVIKEIEKQATDAWDPPRQVTAVAASDYTRVLLPPSMPTAVSGALEADIDLNLEPRIDVPNNHPRGYRGRGGHRGPNRRHAPTLAQAPPESKGESQHPETPNSPSSSVVAKADEEDPGFRKRRRR